METIVMYLLVLIIGLCIGSFLNVVILRALSNESIVQPGSKCPKCQTPLKWWHNIPVLSYLFLGGKCKFCQTKISLQYPLVEIVTGLLFCGIFWKFQFEVSAIFMMIFASLFMVVAVTDLKEKVVFDVHTISIIVLGVVYNVLNLSGLGNEIFEIGSFSIVVPISFINSALGMIAGAVIMELVARSGYLVSKSRAFGEGDSYIAAGLGAIFGIYALPLILLYSLLIQLCYTVPVFCRKLYVAKDFSTLIPFSTFLLIAFVAKTTNLESYFDNYFVFIPFVIVFTGLGLYVSKKIITGLKQEKNLTYMPFGPAMVIAAFIFMFFKF